MKIGFPLFLALGVLAGCTNPSSGSSASTTAKAIQVTTLAGSSTSGTADGTGTNAQFQGPWIIANDGEVLWVGDNRAGSIRKVVKSTGAVTTLTTATSLGLVQSTVNGLYTMGLASDGTHVYVADCLNNRILQVVIATGAVSTLAGTGTAGSTDGSLTVALLNEPMGLAINGTDLYVCDTGNSKIREIDLSAGTVSTVASLTDPEAIATDGTNLYVAQPSGNSIRKIVIATGVVTTLAGSGSSGFADGVGTAAQFNEPEGVSTDGTNVYVADSKNHRIRKIVASTQVVTTYAGSGTAGYVDGPADQAEFDYPAAVASDGTAVYASGDSTPPVVRKIQ